MTVCYCLKHMMKHVWWMKCCSLSLSTQMHHNGDAQIYSDPGGRNLNTPSSMRFSWSVVMGWDRAAAPLNLPSFPRDSSSFWIWFSRKNMATANASSARSCNLGGIMTLSSPIKSSREGFGQSMLSGGDTENTHIHTHSDDGDYKAAECLSMALSPSVCVDFSQCSNPLVTSNAMCSCSARLFHQVNCE